MKRTLSILAGGALLAMTTHVSAGTILQGSGGAVAFEAEENVTLIAGTPTSWVITNDATPSGNKALYAAGANGTVFPTSFATYNIRFTTPGTYKVFFRWRANELYTDADPNAGNSFYAPNKFNSITTPDNPNPDYGAASVNNTRVRPESNSYHVDPENNNLVTVSQEQVDAGVPLHFTVGTREAGFMFDRFVLTQDTSLTEAQFNATPNSDTDVFVQPTGADYVAFEAESSKGTLIGGTPASWVITNDVTPSGNQALYASGANGTVFPTSFASYGIRFSTPGTYKMFFRWRANELYTDADPNAGNSYYAPNKFNGNTNQVNPNPDYGAASVNNTRVRPESNSYHVDSENNNLLTVSQEQVDAGEPLYLNIGTREAGFMFDRIVLTLNPSLTEAQFNALENTGAVVPPEIVSAVGSASLDTIRVKFSKALDEFSLDANQFTLDGGVTVVSLALDPVTLKEVLVTTTPQTEGFNYTLTVNGVNDLGGTFIKPDSKVQFTAWRLAYGFTRREYYFTLSGTAVSDLTGAAKFPASPERVDLAKGLATFNDPRAQNYGVRLTGLFIPTQSGIYDFYMYNDNEAELWLSTDATAAGLALLISSPTTSTGTFDPAVTGASGDLVAGQRYYIQVLLKQGTDYDSYVNVAARRRGDATPISELKTLGGDQIAAYADPAKAILQITRQPLGSGELVGRRIRMEAAATSPGGPAYYQWRVNGQDITGATRAAVYTPPLALADNGKEYTCVIHAGGVIATSAVAVVTVSAGPVPDDQPYIGVSFVGGDAAGASGTLLARDVLGVVPQGNFNNLTGGTGSGVPLVDANGQPTEVTINYDGRTYFTGSGENTAEDVFFQGYLHNANGTVTAHLDHVPLGTYDVYLYAVGFNYNATYEQAMTLAGETAPPDFHVRVEHAGNYASAPSIFRRMHSTSSAARDQGNYVVFKSVSPDTTGGFAITIVNESDNPNDVDVTPALSGLQLVRVPPKLTIETVDGRPQLSWGDGATEYNLEYTVSLGAVPPISWKPVAEVTAPLGSAGTLTIPIGDAVSPRFYRLHKP